MTESCANDADFPVSGLAAGLPPYAFSGTSIFVRRYGDIASSRMRHQFGRPASLVVTMSSIHKRLNVARHPFFQPRLRGCASVSISFVATANLSVSAMRALACRRSVW